MFETLLDFFYPPSCIVCDSVLPTGVKCLCQTCSPKREDFFLTGPSESVCKTCCSSLMISEDGTAFCNICRHAALPFSRIFSVWSYTYRVEKFLGAIKYRTNGHNMIPLAAELVFRQLVAKGAPFEQRFRETNWDMILACPSTNRSISKRGFHHMAILCRLLAAKMDIPFHSFGLESTVDSDRQATLSLEQRVQSKPLGIRCNLNSKKLEGKRVLLIDDVLTTGKTVSEVRAVLGSKCKVDLLTLSRSLNFSKNRLYLVNKQSASLCS